MSIWICILSNFISINLICECTVYSIIELTLQPANQEQNLSHKLRQVYEMRRTWLASQMTARKLTTTEVWMSICHLACVCQNVGKIIYAPKLIRCIVWAPLRLSEPRNAGCAFRLPHRHRVHRLLYSCTNYWTMD